MITDVALFICGALLILIPADVLLSKRVELRSFGCFQSLENSPRARPWWWVPLLWLDPLRALVGTLLLKHMVPGRDEWLTLEKGPYTIMLAILGVGVLAQMFTRRDRSVLLAPVGFVAGAVAALTPWTVAGIGLTLAFTAMFGFRRFPAFFIVGMLGVGALGAAFKAEVMWLIPALGLLALPFLLGAFTGRTFELPTRNDSAVQPAG